MRKSLRHQAAIPVQTPLLPFFLAFITLSILNYHIKMMNQILVFRVIARDITGSYGNMEIHRLALLHCRAMKYFLSKCYGSLVDLSLR